MMDSATPKHAILRQSIVNESDAAVMSMYHRLEREAREAWGKYVLIHAAWQVAQEEADRRYLIDCDHR
jgi:type IV secretory pathway protease TraF